MEALFLKAVNMSLTASWLVLAIMGVRLLFRKTPKWILCLLWGLVAFRLLCPWSVESALSLIPSPEPLPQDMIYTAHPAIHSGIPIVDNTVNPMLAASLTPAELTSANPTQIWSFILSQVWILGMAVMVVYTAVSWLLLRRRVAAAIPLEKGIRQSEYVDSPFVLGVFRPVIYLPFGMAEEDMAFVIAHERAHIRRRDHWWKPLGFLLLSVYWFNPVLWLAYILLCRDIEGACDEKVIRDMEKDERRAYSAALLNCSVHRRAIRACPLAFGETGVKARIKGVMDYRKPAFWVVAAALVLAALVGICFLTDPAGMTLQEIDDSRNYSDLLQDLTDVTLIRNGEKYPAPDTEAVVEVLSRVKVRKTPVSPSRSEERDQTNRIHLRGNTYLNFSRDFLRVWIDNGMKPTYSYWVTDPGSVEQLFDTYCRIPPVVIWFDRLSGAAWDWEEGEMQYPGLPGITLGWGENTGLSMETGGSEETLLGGYHVWNVYFSDLSGDGIPELCATADPAYSKGFRQVVAWDPSEKLLYSLADREERNCSLVYVKGQLAVAEEADDGGTVYGSLRMVRGDRRRLELISLDSSLEPLLKTVVCVDITGWKNTCLSSGEQREKILSLLRELRDKTEQASPEEIAEAQKDPMTCNSVTVNYELGQKSLYFSGDYSLLWEAGSREGYRLSDPEPICRFLEAVTEGVRDRETAGESFAAADSPWDWCAGFYGDAVSSVDLFVCLEITEKADGRTVSTTGGVLPTYVLEELTAVLNGVPKAAFADSGERIQDYRGFWYDQSEGSCALSVIDSVNGLGAVIRLHRGAVEMILTDELEKTSDGSGRYLEPTTVWHVEDPRLEAFLKDLWEEPPIIVYAVGAEYSWQEPIEYRDEGFSLRLRLPEGWEYVNRFHPAHSGILCRPTEVTEGWLYFSFWPDSFAPVEADRYYVESYRNGFVTKTSYPASVSSAEGLNTRDAIWSYQAVYTPEGVFVIQNEGADSWFMEYKDQIADMISLSDFSVK